MPSNDIHMKEQTNTPLTTPRLQNKQLPNVEVPNMEEAAKHTEVDDTTKELAKRAADFLGATAPGVATTHHDNRGHVTDPEHDHRLRQNKNKDDNRPHDDDDQNQEQEDSQEQALREQRERIRDSQEEAEDHYTQKNPRPGFAPKRMAKELSELKTHPHFGVEIARTLGVTPGIEQLAKVRELLNSRVASTKDAYTKSEAYYLLSKVSSLLIRSGALNKTQN